jgi:hypothetical protein
MFNIQAYMARKKEEGHNMSPVNELDNFSGE